MSKKSPAEEQNASAESGDGSTKPIKPAKKIRFKHQEQALMNGVPAESETVEDVADADKPQKTRRAKWIWLGILMVLVITAVGSGIGYYLALQSRLAADLDQRLQTATAQYLMAEQDQASGNLNMARQRIEYIMTIYPDYPGIDEKIKQVLMALALSQTEIPEIDATPETGFTPVATKDTTKMSELFAQANAQYTAGDWQGLWTTVKTMRNIDPTYQPIKVDGLYHAALRNNGIAKIKNGDLEIGLYYFALANSIAPLDKDTEQWAGWARVYRIAAVWYGVDWYKSAEGFLNVMQQVPNLTDASHVTAKQRYGQSLEGYGDYLMKNAEYCAAVDSFTSASGVVPSDAVTNKITQAQTYCANPPATPTPTIDPYAPKPTPTVDSYNPTG